MKDRYAGIQRFFGACEEFISGSYMLADVKLTEILKAVAASAELTELFDAATDKFDYPAAKRAYLRYPYPKGSSHGAAYLPAERKEILAFVFCVLVELDAGNLKMNDFLLRYFYKDGSYTASYKAFAERMIRPFFEIVRDCFPDDGRRRAEEAARAKRREETAGRLSALLGDELARIQSLPLAEEDLKAAQTVLAAMNASLGADGEALPALLIGYGCLLKCLAVGEGQYAALSALAEELK